MGDASFQTRNSVEDIWGQRKPYRGTWPIRCDEHYVEEPEKWVQSACVMCSNGCGMDIGVKDGKIVGVRGREVDRVNHGRLGPKGMYAWKSLQHADRLKYPMIRRHGKLERASWDEAMELIVKKTKETRERLTSHGIAFYTSGQLFLEEYYAEAIIGKGGLNAIHMDGNTRLCTATAAASMRENFGSDGQPGSYTDVDFTSCIMLVGHNMSATQTVLWARILDRLEGPQPPELIIIDPRLSNSAKKATLHLKPRIGTNCALLNGIEHLLFTKGYINEEYLKRHVIGRDELWATVKEYTTDVVEKITGVPTRDLEKAADILGRTPSLLSTCLQGVYQSNQATASACQVNNINLLLGHIGRPGSGIFQMNGQPTAQNNREAGCNGEYPGFRNFSNENHMRALADIWNIEYRKLPHWNQPTHVENLLTFMKSSSIEMLWVSGTNPLVSLPDLPKTREIFAKKNLFVVVQDIFPTETTAVADVVLPAAAWGEKTGCFTNVDRTVHISHKAVDPPGEAKSDLAIFVDFAKRMEFKDKDGEPLIKFETSEEAFEAWKKCSKGQPCDYSGMSYELLSQGSGIQWPCNEENPVGKERLFTDGVFFTATEVAESFGHDLETGAPLTKAQYNAMAPNGRAMLKPCHYLPESEAVSEEYPLQLSTGRQTRHFHTRTKTGRTKELQSVDSDSWIQLNEQDAEKYGIKEDDMVIAESRRGKIEVKARVGNIERGQTFVPMHYGYFDSPDGRSRAGNELTQEQWDPVSKQPMFKSGAIKVSKAPNTGKVNVQEQQTKTVKNVEHQMEKYSDHTEVIAEAYKGVKMERLMEYWLGETAASLDTLVAISDKIIPHFEGVDFEIMSGMRIMHRIATTCATRLKPFTEKYRCDLTLGHELSTALEQRLFPKNPIGITESPAYDVLIALESYYVYVSHIQAHLFALRPTAQAAWDEEFTDAVLFIQDQLKRIQAWTQQQMESRGPQTLYVPTRAAAGLHERAEKRREKNNENDELR